MMDEQGLAAPRAQARRGLRKVLLRLTLAAGSILATCLGAEVALRGWLALRGRAYDRAAVEEAMRREVDAMAAFVPEGKEDLRPDSLAGRVLHPFTGSELYPDTGGVLAYFREGVPDDAYTVVVVGGSVAASWAGDEDRVFASRLEADPRLAGKRVEILRYAHAAYKQPQQLMRVSYLFSFGYRPDAIVNLDGFNEVANGLQNSLWGTHPIYPTPPVWEGIVSILTSNQWAGVTGGEAFDTAVELRSLIRRAHRLVERTLGWRLASSSLLGTLSLKRLERTNARRTELQQRLARILAEPKKKGKRDFELKGPPVPKTFEEVMRIAVGCWYEGSLSIGALCDARGVYYLHCLQPTLLDPGSKPLTERERALRTGPEGWKRGVEAGYPMLRERGRELVAHGVGFVDTSGCLSKLEDNAYVDACHVNNTGNRLLAEAIADAFLEHLP
jgi:hypothetical protein